MRFFVDREVAGGDDAFARAWVFFTDLACQRGHHLVDGDVKFSMVFCLSADDQRCAGFVNQDRVDLVDDGEVHTALHTVFGLVDHVVTQIIKTKFVVGTVGNVCAVGGLFVGTWHLRQIHANRQA